MSLGVSVLGVHVRGGSVLSPNKSCCCVGNLTRAITLIIGPFVISYIQYQKTVSTSIKGHKNVPPVFVASLHTHGG